MCDPIEDKLYNSEIKVQFIEERNKEVILPENYLERQFRKTAEFERKLNKDLSNFTFCEIVEYYKLLNVPSFESLSVMNSQFSLYTQWCLQNNLVKDNKNHFLEIKIEIMKSCINKALFDMKIVSKKTVLTWVDQLPNPKDQFVLLGLFEGIKGKDFLELLRLRPEDIKGNMTTLYNGRKVKISNKLISVINNCIEEDKYYSITGRAIKIMPLINRGYIIKDYPNAREDVCDFSAGRKIYNSIIRILNYFDAGYMTANSITESGKLHMIKEHAKQLGLSNRDYIYSDFIDEVEEQYDCNISKLRKSFYLKYEEYLTD